MDKNDKWEENVEGPYYVDESCIAAKLCVAVASDLFSMSNSGHAYVIRQPQTPEQEDQARQAMNGCPVRAIGDDG